VRVIETLAKNYADTPGVRGLLVSTRDITKHVSEQRALRGAIAEADDLYNNAPCGYHSLDENGVLVRINDTELRWLGRTREEVAGKMRFQDLLSSQSRTLFERQFPVLKALRLVENLEFELLRKDGSALSVLLSATALTDKRAVRDEPLDAVRHYGAQARRNRIATDEPRAARAECRELGADAHGRGVRTA
jgi:PAS domain S-box-containing protein